MILLNDVLIVYQSKVKNMGIIINQTLTWEDHINQISRRIYGHLRRLWKFSDYIPINTKIILIKSLLIPHILYEDILFHPMSSDCSTKLQVIFNDCIRYIYHLRRFDHISMYSDIIFGCSLFKYLDYRCCYFLYKLRCSGNPTYLYNLITFANSRRTENFIVPRFTCRSLGMSFFVYAIKLWNALPVNAKRAVTTFKFKKESGYFRELLI